MGDGEDLMGEELDPAALVALATELEKEGQYNVAKLLRAVAISTLNRQASLRPVPSAPMEQAALVAELADRLQGAPAALAPSLRDAAGVLARGGVALVEEAPDPFVCRECGEARAGGFDHRCPTCGRWPTTVERIRPVSWLRESSPPEALERMRRAPEEIERLVAGASEEQLTAPARDGGWSARQTIQHLHNAQGVFRSRIDQLLAGGEPLLRSVMVWTMGGEDSTTAHVFDAYRRLRAEIVDVLEQADPAAFWSTGWHEEWGRVSLAEQLSYFANHEPTHLGQIADALT